MTSEDIKHQLIICRLPAFLYRERVEEGEQEEESKVNKSPKGKMKPQNLVTNSNTRHPHPRGEKSEALIALLFLGQNRHLFNVTDH